MFTRTDPLSRAAYERREPRASRGRRNGRELGPEQRRADEAANGREDDADDQREEGADDEARHAEPRALPQRLDQSGRTFSGRSALLRSLSISWAWNGPISSVTGIASTCHTTTPMTPARSPTSGAVAGLDGCGLAFLKQVGRGHAAGDHPQAAAAVADADDGQGRQDAEHESAEQGRLELGGHGSTDARRCQLAADSWQRISSTRCPTNFVRMSASEQSSAAGWPLPASG